MQLFFGGSVVVPESKQLIGLEDMSLTEASVPDEVFECWAVEVEQERCEYEARQEALIVAWCIKNPGRDPFGVE